jgi:hypothetical protein
MKEDERKKDPHAQLFGLRLSFASNPLSLGVSGVPDGLVLFDLF